MKEKRATRKPSPIGSVRISYDRDQLAAVARALAIPAATRGQLAGQQPPVDAVIAAAFEYVLQSHVA